MFQEIQMIIHLNNFLLLLHLYFMDHLNYYYLEKSSKLIKIEGSKLSYECFNYPQLEKINFLLPDFIVIGKGEPLPGLVLRYLPEDPDFNEEIKMKL